MPPSESMNTLWDAYELWTEKWKRKKRREKEIPTTKSNSQISSLSSKKNNRQHWSFLSPLFNKDEKLIFPWKLIHSIFQVFNFFNYYLSNYLILTYFLELNQKYWQSNQFLEEISSFLTKIRTFTFAMLATMRREDIFEKKVFYTTNHNRTVLTKAFSLFPTVVGRRSLIYS